MEPIKLAPVYKSSIWAGRKINNIRGLDGDNIGIAREVCAYKGSENIVRNGVHAGKKISEVIRLCKQELLGDIDSDQLVRVAYMDAEQDLSIQVHPTAEKAALVQDLEKSEAWYVLDAKEGSCVTVGISIDDPRQIEDRILSGDLEEVLIRKPVRKGDFVLVPAGMIHACGAGLFVIEIGSYGGITYRLYDYGRGRSLDIEKGMDAMDPALRTTIIHCPPMPGQSQIGVDHPLFRAEVIDADDRYIIENNASYYVLTCVENACQIRTKEGELPLEYTESVLIPANSGECIVLGNARLIKSYMKA